MSKRYLILAAVLTLVIAGLTFAQKEATPAENPPFPSPSPSPSPFSVPPAATELSDKDAAPPLPVWYPPPVAGTYTIFTAARKTYLLNTATGNVWELGRRADGRAAWLLTQRMESAEEPAKPAADKGGIGPERVPGGLQADKAKATSPSVDMLGYLLEVQQYDLCSIRPDQVIADCTAMLAKPADLENDTLGKLYRLRGLAYFFSSDYGKAKVDFLKASTVTKDDVDDLRTIALTTAYLRGIEEAQNQLREIIKGRPTCPKCKTAMGAVYLLDDKIDKAIEQFTLSVKLDPSYPQAFYLRAHAYFIKTDFENCLRDVNAALLLDPLVAGPGAPEDPYLLRARARATLGQFSEAVNDFLMATKLNPASVEAALGLPRCRFMEGRLHLADRLFEDVVRDFPKSADALVESAVCKRALQKHREAESLARKAVSLDATNSKAYCIIGASQEAFGLHKDAQENFEKALKVDPDNLQSLTAFSEFLSSCEDPSFRDGKRALDLAKKACRLRVGKWNDLCYLALAKAYAECGDTPNAVRAMVKCSAFAPIPGLKEYVRDATRLLERGKTLDKLNEGSDPPSGLSEKQ
jgi:tetratricopeptide (TPR) repeat protein